MVNPLLAYIGPETVLPLASVLAAVAGGLLFCWRWVMALFVRGFGLLAPGRAARRAAEGAAPPPDEPVDSSSMR